MEKSGEAVIMCGDSGWEKEKKKKRKKEKFKYS